MTPEECRAYWASRVEGHANSPSQYATRDRSITDFQHHFWSPEVTPDDSILELGPNAGANLQRLFELGHRNLAGVEINSAAVSGMREYLPVLAAVADIRIGPLEDVLPELPDRSHDLVFAVGVLSHVHPESNWLFDEIARIARRHI